MCVSTCVHVCVSMCVHVRVCTRRCVRKCVCRGRKYTKSVSTRYGSTRGPKVEAFTSSAPSHTPGHRVNRSERGGGRTQPLYGQKFPVQLPGRRDGGAPAPGRGGVAPDPSSTRRLWWDRHESPPAGGALWEVLHCAGLSAFLVRGVSTFYVLARVGSATDWLVVASSFA